MDQYIRYQRRARVGARGKQSGDEETERQETATVHDGAMRCALKQ
jgi:hypothetical protein